MRTSLTHPLLIADLSVPGHPGRIGITFCPGKVDAQSMSGPWARDLDADLDVIRAWGAAAVVTLIEDHEFELLKVPGLAAGVAAREMRWHHLPIRDVDVPGAAFERRWREAGPALHALLQAGQRVLVHCRGGLGRAGTVAARLLVEAGVAPGEAINMVRKVRPGAIETRRQEDHVRGLRAQA